MNRASRKWIGPVLHVFGSVSENNNRLQTRKLKTHIHLFFHNCHNFLNHTMTMAALLQNNENITLREEDSDGERRFTVTAQDLISLGFLFVSLGINASAETGRGPDKVALVPVNAAGPDAIRRDENPYSTTRKVTIKATLFIVVTESGKREDIEFASGEFSIIADPSNKLAELTFTQDGCSKANLKTAIRPDKRATYNKKKKRFTFNCINKVNGTKEVETFSTILKSDDDISKFKSYFARSG